MPKIFWTRFNRHYSALKLFYLLNYKFMHINKFYLMELLNKGLIKIYFCPKLFYWNTSFQCIPNYGKNIEFIILFWFLLVHFLRSFFVSLFFLMYSLWQSLCRYSSSCLSAVLASLRVVLTNMRFLCICVWSADISLWYSHSVVKEINSDIFYRLFLF